MFTTYNVLLEIYVGPRRSVTEDVNTKNCYLCQLCHMYMYISRLVSYILSQTYAKLWHFQSQFTTSTNIKLIFHFRPVSSCPLIIAYLNIEFLYLNVVDSMNQAAVLTNWIFKIQYDNLYTAGWFKASTTSTNKNSILIFILTLNFLWNINMISRHDQWNSDKLNVFLRHVTS